MQPPEQPEQNNPQQPPTPPQNFQQMPPQQPPTPPQNFQQMPQIEVPASTSAKLNKLTRILTVFAVVTMIAAISMYIAKSNDAEDNFESASGSSQIESESNSIADAKYSIKSSKNSKDITSASVDAECFSYKVTEGTKTLVHTCSTVSIYHSEDRSSNGLFEVHINSTDLNKKTKLDKSVVEMYKSSIIEDELAKSAGRQFVSGKYIKVDGLPAYQFITKDSNGYIGTYIIVETQNLYEIDGYIEPFFTIRGEYDNSDGGTKTYFDNALASFKWKN